MKKIYFLSACFLITTVALSQSSVFAKQGLASMPQVSWLAKANLSRSSAYVQNQGQFDEFEGAVNRGILYQIDDHNMQVSFTAKGLIYKISTSEKVSEHEWEEFVEKYNTNLPEEEAREKRERDQGVQKDHYIPRSALVEMNWEGASEQMELVAEDATENYFNYLNMVTDRDHIIGNVKGFKKLTYKNVYPNIDVQYTIHPTEGIKYSYILHPGAHPSDIKMHYTGAKIKTDADNNLLFVTEGGTMTDHAPLTFRENELSGRMIESEFFIINKNTVGFKLANDLNTASETLIIDPWQVGPSFPANGYTPNDLSVDGAGNVFVYSVKPPPFLGVSTTQQLHKYNSAGALQWSLNLSSNLQYTNWQGDVAADPAGNVYLSIGLGPNNNTAFYNTVKIDPTGTTLLWGSFTAGTGANNMLETWTITFNCDYTQFYQSGGGRVVGGTTYFNMSVEEPVNAATGTEGVLIENDSLGDIYCTYYAPNSLVYHMTTDSNVTPNLSGGLMAPSTGTKNNLICFNPSTGVRLFRVQLGNGYDYQDGDAKAPFSVGMNAMVSSCQYLYTMSGQYLDRWNPTTGAHYNQVAIPGGQGGHAASANVNAGSPSFSINSGILTDKCGNVYVGSNNIIYIYDPNLNLIGSIGGLPGRVFDIAWKSAANSEMLVCGGTSNATTFLADVSVPACTLPNQVSITPTQPTCNTPLGSASASATFCGAPYTYSWSNGQTGQTATNLPPGTYTVTVSSSISCPYSYVETQTVTINTAPGTPNASASATAVPCFGGSTGTATVTPSGGSGSYSYTWTPSGGNGQTASGLPAGNYTVLVQDGSGCSTSTTVAVGQPGSAVSLNISSSASVTCNGASTGSANASASGGAGSYTYTWSPVGGNGASASNLPAGTYTCYTTDGNGCQASNVVTIGQPASAVSASPSSTQAGCGQSNGSANANASGGTGAYSYTWTPAGGNGASATNLPAGNYTVTVADANGCTTTAPVAIGSSGSSVSVNISATASVSCTGGSNGSANANASGGSGSYTYTWSPIGGNASTATNLPAGTYTCTSTDGSGCLGSNVITISEPASAVSATSSFTPATCGQSNGVASASGSGGTGSYTYTWTPAGGNSSTTTANLPSGNYTCTVTDGNGCAFNTPVTITNSGGPNVTSTANTSVTCNSGNDGTASVNASGGTGTITYTWVPIGGNNSSANNLPGGTYTCNVSDATGCITSTVITVSEPAAIVVTPSFTPAACGQNNGSASVNASGGAGGYTYTWTPSGGNSSSATGLGAGNYTCTITDANNCTQATGLTITNSGGPTVNATATGSITCNGASTGSATVSASGGTGSYTYTWSPVGGNGSSASSLPAGSYTVDIADGNNCLTQTVVTISQPAAALNASVTSASVACNGASTGSATATASGGTSGYTYTWTPSGGNNATATGLGANTYTCNITDANGCPTNAVVTISEPTVLSLSLSSTSLTCNGGANGTATANASGGTAAYTYTWQPSGGNAATANGLGSGTYTCFITDANGCTKNASVAINQPTPVQATVTSVPVTCNGSANGTASAVVSGGTGAYTYTWTPSGGNNASATGLGAGTFTCNITDASGCTTSGSAIISEPAGITLIVNPTDVLCNAGSTGSATVGANGGTGAITYTWAPIGGNNSSASNLPAGSYTCFASDANGCTSFSVVTINQPVPIVVTPTVNNVSCSGGSNGSANLGISGGTGPYSVSWNTTPAQSGPSATGLPAGAYVATITDANNCPQTQPVVIADILPVDTLAITGTLCTNDVTVLLSAPTGGVAPDVISAPYQWYSGLTSIAGASGATYSGSQAVVNGYSVTWYLHGCRYVTTTILETIYQDISSMPQTNIFTPNDDKVNDEFLPISLTTGTVTITYQQVADVVDEYTLYIYDRWGTLVFQSEQVLNFWTGVEPNGKEATSGTYFWMAKYKTKCNAGAGEQVIKGFVQLIR